MAKIPDIPSTEVVPAGPLSWVKNWLDTIRLWVQIRDPNSTMVGGELDKFTTRDELMRLGLIQRTETGRLIGVASNIPGPKGDVGPAGPPGAGVTPPDLTPPPTPTGLTVTPTFAHIIIEWDAPTYTQGKGNAFTNVYGAMRAPGDPAPTFVDAKLIDSAQGATTIHAYPSQLGVTWHIWIKFLSRDGVESTSPAGGINGVSATLGKVGNSDLGNAIIQSQQLADKAVTPEKALLNLGGSNLLANNSFEVDANNDGLADGWGPYNNTTLLEPETLTHTPGRLDGYAQRIAWAGTNTSSKGFFTAIDIGGGVRGGWQPGKTYVVSWYARANGAKPGIGMQLAWNQGPAASAPIENPDLAGVWLRYAYRITMDTVVETQGRLYITVAYGAPITGWVEVDDVQVEEGDYLSGYFGRLAAQTIVAGDGAIANFAITNALIANLAVDDAKMVSVSVAKLLAGAIAVGEYIQSTDYVPGVSGWRIHGNGFAELAAAAIRGQLTAAQIDGRGLIIRDNLGNPIFGVGTNLDHTRIVPSSTWLNTNVGAVNMLWGAQNGPLSAGPTQYGSSPEIWIKSGSTNPHGIMPGEVLTVSSDLWQDSANASVPDNYAVVYLWAQDSGGNWWASASFGIDPGSTDKVRGSATLTIPSDPARSHSIGLAVYHQPANSPSHTYPGTVYADRVQVERGGAATQYKPGAQPGATVGAPSGTLVGSILAQDVESQSGATDKANAAQAAAIAAANAGLAVKLNKDAADTLSATLSIAAATGAGFRAGSLTWDAAGNRTGGAGVAMTPGGLVGHNGTQVTFSINAATGAATFAGELSAASGSLGDVTVADKIRLGKTAYGSGTGFIVEWNGGTPRLDIGSASQYLRWTGTNLEIKLDTFTASLGSNISVTGVTDLSPFSIGVRSVSVSGGVAPYTYAWTIEYEGVGAVVYINGDTSGTTVSVIGDLASTAGGASGLLNCFVTDANGRTAVGRIGVQFWGSLYNP